MLREESVFYIVSGATSVDLVRAIDLLGEHLLLEGGGHMNGAFLQENLTSTR